MADYSVPDDLLILVAAGDLPAFTLLISRLRPRILGFVRRILRDHHQAEEVVQETFLEVWQRAGRFDPHLGSAVGWIFQLAHARAVDRIRHVQAGRLRDDRFAARRHIEFDSVIETVLSTLEQAEIRQALSQLSALQRQSILLCYFAGLSHAEVAELLRIPVATVKTRVRDGLTKLRGTLLAAS